MQDERERSAVGVGRCHHGVAPSVSWEFAFPTEMNGTKHKGIQCSGLSGALIPKQPFTWNCFLLSASDGTTAL